MSNLASRAFCMKGHRFAESGGRTYLFQVGFAFLFTVCAILMSTSMAAQTLGSGSIQGTVTDQSGAVVSSATVTATKTDTGQSITARTTSAGFYDLPNLEPGQYHVAVNVPGFEKLVQDNVTVVAFGTVGLNMQLKVGSAGQTVTVSALAPQIDTTNGTLETEIPHEVYNSLPIAMANGPKNPLGFVSLAPGVTQGGNATFKLNGGAAEASQIYVNGMPAPEALIGGDLRTVTGDTPLEAVSDSQVLTSGIPAYYTGAGVVNIVIKSGTSQFHGNIYENLRNTAFDAAGYFASSTPVEHQNEFGASLGGPILKKRMFFFFNYDGYRLLQGQNPVITTIPTLAERQGDFSALPVPIYDEATTNCVGNICSRQQFPGNIIPQNRISPISQFLQAQLPQPMNSSIVNNYSNGYNDGFNQDMFIGKLDYSITNSNRLAFVAQDGSQVDTGIPRTFPTMLPLPYASARYSPESTKLYQVKDTQTITPNLINVFGYQFNSLDNPLENATTSGDWATKAGLAGTPTGLAGQDFPPVTFAGPNSPGSWALFNFSASQDNYARTNTLQDNMQWVRGKHDLTFGGMWQSQVADQTTPSQLTSNTFTNLQTSGYSAAGAVSTTEGNAYASYLLGAEDAASLYDTTVPAVRGRFSNYALFLGLFLNPGFNFALPPWRDFPQGTKDTDGLDDGKVPLQDQLRSEFDFSGFFQDASGLAGNALPVFEFVYSMTYARDPGQEQMWKPGMRYSAIYQFGPNATKTNGDPVLRPEVREYIGGDHFPARLATNTDLSKGLMDAGVRIVYSAGYHTVMWIDEQGQWQTGSLDDQNKIRFPFYSKGSPKRFGSFALLVKGNDPEHSPAIGLYIPQSSVLNEQPIVGLDIKTGKHVYAEDRRTSWLMSTERIGPADPNEKSIRSYLVDDVPIENHFTILRPVLRYSGLLAPSHALPGVEERIRCEEFLLIGTPNQIRAAVEEIKRNLKKEK